MSWCSVRFLLLALPFWLMCLQGREFLYPVAVIDSDNTSSKLYLLYQKSTMHVELWLWDSETKHVRKGLLSSYTPAGLKILPDKSGFSFIDNGRIRIKLFKKRSVQSLNIYEPLHNINTVEWIDNNQFYLGAKKGNEYGIFQVNKHGDVKTVAAHEGVDCMYPQKVGEKLFYIERSGNPQHYQIVCIPYPVITYQKGNFNNTQNFESKVAALIFGNENMVSSSIKRREKRLIHEAGDRPMIFLQMLSQVEGFYIEHQGSIEQQDKTVTFRYHHIKEEGGHWNSSFLFSFSIPIHLISLSSDLRLHESILPLVPRHNGKKIYFSDCSARSVSLGVDLFSYSLSSGQIKQLSFGIEEEQFFSPIFVGNAIFYGGSLVKGKGLPAIWVNEKEYISFDLPTLSLSGKNSCDSITATV